MWRAINKLYESDRYTFALSIAGLLSVIILYAYSAGSSPFWIVSYEWLGHGFFKGMNYLPEHPPANALAPSYPYTLELLSYAKVLPDVSFINRHSYLYFGPAPALFPWMSLEWLTGISLNDSQMAFLFALGGTGCLLFLLAKIIMQQSKLPIENIWLAIMAMCFGGWIPQILHQPGIYGASDLGAYFFIAVGLLCLWPQENDASPSLFLDIRRLLGSLCMGFAVGCRLGCMFDCIILGAVWFSVYKRGYDLRENVRAALYLGAPWLLCLQAYGVYNFGRFGSAFETGARFQLIFSDMHTTPVIFSPIHNFYEYFLKPVPLLAWLSHQLPSCYENPPNMDTTCWSPLYGLLVNSPFALWGLWFLYHLRRHKEWLGSVFIIMAGLALYTLAVTLWLVFYYYPFNRAGVDITPWIMLFAVLGYVKALQDAPEEMQEKLRLLGNITAIYSILIGVISVAV
jgi:hypothetical protein